MDRSSGIPGLAVPTKLDTHQSQQQGDTSASDGDMQTTKPWRIPLSILVPFLTAFIAMLAAVISMLLIRSTVRQTAEDNINLHTRSLASSEDAMFRQMLKTNLAPLHLSYELIQTGIAPIPKWNNDLNQPVNLSDPDVLYWLRYWHTFTDVARVLHFTNGDKSFGIGPWHTDFSVAMRSLATGPSSRVHVGDAFRWNVSLDGGVGNTDPIPLDKNRAWVLDTAVHKAVHDPVYMDSLPSAVTNLTSGPVVWSPPMTAGGSSSVTVMVAARAFKSDVYNVSGVISTGVDLYDVLDRFDLRKAVKTHSVGQHPNRLFLIDDRGFVIVTSAINKTETCGVKNMSQMEGLGPVREGQCTTVGNTTRCWQHVSSTDVFELQDLFAECPDAMLPYEKEEPHHHHDGHIETFHCAGYGVGRISVPMAYHDRIADFHLFVVNQDTDIDFGSKLSHYFATEGLLLFIVIDFVVIFAISFATTFIWLAPLRRLSVKIRAMAKLKKGGIITKFSQWSEIRTLQLMHNQCKEKLQSIAGYIPQYLLVRLHPDEDTSSVSSPNVTGPSSFAMVDGSNSGASAAGSGNHHTPLPASVGSPNVLEMSRGNTQSSMVATNAAAAAARARLKLFEDGMVKRQDQTSSSLRTATVAVDDDDHAQMPIAPLDLVLDEDGQFTDCRMTSLYIFVDSNAVAYDQVQKFFNIALATIQDSKGVVDTVTVDSLQASFNCHLPQPLHQEAAIVAALEIKSHAPALLTGKFSIMIDANQGSSVTVGNSSVRSRLVICKAVDTARKIAPLLRLHKCVVGVTERIARVCPFMAVPLDNVALQNDFATVTTHTAGIAPSMGVNVNTEIILEVFDCPKPDEFSPHVIYYNTAFTDMLQGRFHEAQDHWESARANAGGDPTTLLRITRFAELCKQAIASRQTTGFVHTQGTGFKITGQEKRVVDFFASTTNTNAVPPMTVSVASAAGGLTGRANNQTSMHRVPSTGSAGLGGDSSSTLSHPDGHGESYTYSLPSAAEGENAVCQSMPKRESQRDSPDYTGSRSSGDLPDNNKAEDPSLLFFGTDFDMDE